MKKLSFEKFAASKIETRSLSLVVGGGDTTWSQPGTAGGTDWSQGSTTTYSDGGQYNHSTGKWTLSPGQL